jgi:S1-C subfamily serine protease
MWSSFRGIVSLPPLNSHIAVIQSMVNRALRIPVWLVVPALLATFVVGTRARSAVPSAAQPAFRIVTSDVSDVVTQDLTPEIARNLRINQRQGVLVSDVIGSPLYPGDVILSINGIPVRCQADLDAQLANVSSEQPLTMDVYRDGRVQTVTVERALETPRVTVLQDAVEVRGITVASLSTQNGVIVAHVGIATPASDMGLRTGDIILDVNGHPVRTAAEFAQFMHELNDRPASFNVRHRNGQVNVFEIAT